MKKTVVITGASSGIGAAVAQRLAAKGYNIVLAARGPEALERVAAECRAVGGGALVVSTDVSQSEELARLAKAAVAEYGRIDAWINNASVFQFGRFQDVPEDEFQQGMEVNLHAVITGSRIALKRFLEQDGGTLINLSSGFGALPGPFLTPYVTSKFAVRGFTAGLRQELYLDGHKNIQVCAVLPSTIKTPVYEHAANHLGVKVRTVPPVYSVNAAARKIARLVDRPKGEIVVGRPIRLMVFFYALLPNIFPKIFARYVRFFALTREPTETHSGDTFASLSRGETKGSGRNEAGHNES